MKEKTETKAPSQPIKGERERLPGKEPAEIAWWGKEMFQKYLEVTGVICVVIGGDEQVKLINRKGCQVLGYEEQEIIGKNWFDNFLPERLRGEVRAVFRKLMAGEVESVEFFENPVLTQTGEERVITWHNAVLEEKGKIIAILSSGEDITERKRSEEALRQSEEKYRRVLEEMQDSYLETDLAGNFTFCNDATCRYLSYSRQELIGMNYRDVTEPEDLETVYRAFNRVYRTGEPGGMVEFRYKRKDGSTGYCELVVSGVCDSTGKMVGFRAISRDITERKRMEEERKALEQKAQVASWLQ